MGHYDRIKVHSNGFHLPDGVDYQTKSLDGNYFTYLIDSSGRIKIDSSNQSGVLKITEVSINGWVNLYSFVKNTWAEYYAFFTDNEIQALFQKHEIEVELLYVKDSSMKDHFYRKIQEERTSRLNFQLGKQ